MSSSSFTGTLRRLLLTKITSNPDPSHQGGFFRHLVSRQQRSLSSSRRRRIDRILPLKAWEIDFKHAYYSPTLWNAGRSKKLQLHDTARKLLPAFSDNASKVIVANEQLFFRNSVTQEPSMSSVKGFLTGFEYITVPLKANIVIGAI